MLILFTLGLKGLSTNTRHSDNNFSLFCILWATWILLTTRRLLSLHGAWSKKQWNISFCWQLVVKSFFFLLIFMFFLNPGDNPHSTPKENCKIKFYKWSYGRLHKTLKFCYYCCISHILPQEIHWSYILLTFISGL